MKVKITAIRKADYADLQKQFENPIEHTCDVVEGQSWISENGEKPEVNNHFRTARTTCPRLRS